MTSHPKLQPQHLARQAVVYIRQSTQRQVDEHLESQDLQYQLAQRAAALGWPPERIVVIDDDLGKSAISAAHRPGFQALVAAVALHQVGLILVTDVSRLARNCADWYHLLDLASHSGCLLSDASGMYDPRLYDDRLLLGLKGAFSEAQWFAMRSQLTAALFNKARRGELAFSLPVGYDRLPEGQVILAPDLEVQGAICLVFQQFARLGSARQVLRYCRQQRLLLPHRSLQGPDCGLIRWQPPCYHAIYSLLKQPAYAGAYAYGKQERLRLPGEGQLVRHRRRPVEEWIVLKQDAWPAYITWEQFQENQARLAANALRPQWGPGAPRRGSALLQGIVFCGRCGRAMRPRYRDKPAYVCEATTQSHDLPRCQRFSAWHVDQAVSQLLLQAVEPARLEAALAALAEVEGERRRLATHWQQRLERAHYEVRLAQRRYEQVDPERRLVAAELERLWEEKLQAWQALQGEWDALQKRQPATLDPAERTQMLALAQDLPALWQAETTTAAERKRLLRCLIQDVTLDSFSQPGYTRIAVRWHTGATTQLAVPRPRPGHPPIAAVIVERVRSLAQEHPDDQVAEILNREGPPTTTGLPWTPERVRNLRGKHRIPSGCPALSRQPGPRGDGLFCVAEVAQRLQASPGMVCDWFRRSLLVGHQPHVRSPLWIRLNDDDLARYNGAAACSPAMIPLAAALAVLGLSQEAFRSQVQTGQLLTYRLFLHNRWRWFVLKPDDQPTRIACSE